jgi:hypothetical protein
MIKFNLKTRIRFNGQEYSGVDAMPADVRQAYEQAISRARAAQTQPGETGVHTSTKVVFNGHEYGNVDEMPAELRGQYEQIMAMYDKNHNGIPDVLETGLPAPVAPAQETGTLMEAAPLISTPVTPPENRGWIRPLILILAVVLVLVAMVVLLTLVKAGMH